MRRLNELEPTDLRSVKFPETFAGSAFRIVGVLALLLAAVLFFAVIAPAAAEVNRGNSYALAAVLLSGATAVGIPLLAGCICLGLGQLADHLIGQARVTALLYGMAQNEERKRVEHYEAARTPARS